MPSLAIRWQRLVKNGRTCTRCGDTEDEVRSATVRLWEVLAPLGIEPHLEVGEVDESAFLERPVESNRIWIADRPMEDWLSGTVGSSPCCSVCGDADCRTVEISGTTFEAIPEWLIIKAALIAVAASLDETTRLPLVLHIAPHHS
ncbi:MAG TPA: DUF2703 domain-containing protein [Nocardioides sp.]|nr:DUF2703 domain-containing protein [Nocardioides sp.]